MTASWYLCATTEMTMVCPLEGGRAVWRCHRCALLGVYPRPTFEEVQARCSPDIYVGREDELSQPANQRKRECYKRAIRILRSHYRKSGRLLDVGCGLGSFMTLAHEHGFDVCGVDVSPHAVEHVRERLALPAFAG